LLVSLFFVPLHQKSLKRSFNMSTLNELRSIEQHIIDIGKQMQQETKVCGAELEERLRLGLTGKAAIDHYNTWMKRYHMEHLIITEE